MPVEVIIPSLGVVVEEVTILKWLKSEGDHVEKGEPVLEVESEKVTTAIESPSAGVIGRILCPEGAKVPVTCVVAVIVAEGEAVPALYQKPSVSAATSAAQAAEPAGGAEEKPPPIRAAPLARKIAQEKGVDLSLISPTGPHGTIMKKDVEAYLAAVQEQKPDAASLAAQTKGAAEGGKAAVSAAAGPAGRLIPLSSMRKTNARRMSESAFSVPHIYLFNEVSMDALIQLHESIRALVQEQCGVKVSLNDFIIKAVAVTLKEFPYLNARWESEAIRVFDEVHIGLAVALEEGLIVPAIPAADRTGVAEIARQRRDLVERARQGKLQNIELERGTFTITSLAKFGITQFTALINPPQSAILSVGAIQEKVVMKEGKVCVQQWVTLGLSVDHRVADGAYGAAFLDSVRKKIENPLVAFLHV